MLTILSSASLRLLDDEPAIVADVLQPRQLSHSHMESLSCRTQGAATYAA